MIVTLSAVCWPDEPRQVQPARLSFSLGQVPLHRIGRTARPAVGRV